MLRTDSYTRCRAYNPRSGASGKLLTVDAPNTVQAKAGERIGLLIAPEAVRLLPPES